MRHPMQCLPMKTQYTVNFLAFEYPQPQGLRKIGTKKRKDNVLHRSALCLKLMVSTRHLSVLYVDVEVRLKADGMPNLVFDHLLQPEGRHEIAC